MRKLGGKQEKREFKRKGVENIEKEPFSIQIEIEKRGNYREIKRK